MCLTQRVKSPADLVRRGIRLEYLTLGWNVVGVVVVTLAAISARSVALAGFGLDTLIEIGASIVVVWELRSVSVERRHRAMRLIGTAFIILVVYLVVLTIFSLVHEYHARHSPIGIVWSALTALTMGVLAGAKHRTGTSLGNSVLLSESRVTLIDALLALAVVTGLCLNTGLGWWWADPASGIVIIYYALREARHAFSHD